MRLRDEFRLLAIGSLLAFMAAFTLTVFGMPSAGAAALSQASFESELGEARLPRGCRAAPFPPRPSMRRPASSGMTRAARAALHLRRPHRSLSTLCRVGDSSRRPRCCRRRCPTSRRTPQRLSPSFSAISANSALPAAR